jgi:hypothetical protein
LIVFFALARAFFRQADGLDDFESVHGSLNREMLNR